MDFQTHSIGANKAPVRFITLPKSDPDFSSYIDGIGADGLRAVPVESFAVNSQRERVTFALYARDATSRDLIHGLFTVARLELLSLTFGPLLLGIAACYTRASGFSVWMMGCMVLAMACIHVAAFARNDVADHQNGVDRLQRRRGSQAIQRGWISVVQVRRLSQVALVVGALAALPISWQAPVQLLLLIGFGLVAVLGFSLTRGFKAQGFGDLVVGLCMGPLVTYGVGEVLAPGHALWMISVGLPLGLAAVVVFQMRQFESILTERQVESGTLVARLGFDRTKRLLHRELMALPMLVLISLYPWVNSIVLVSVVTLVTLGQWPLSKRVTSAVSPLASQLVGIGRLATWFHLCFVLLLMVVVGSAQ